MSRRQFIFTHRIKITKEEGAYKLLTQLPARSLIYIAGAGVEAGVGRAYEVLLTRQPLSFNPTPCICLLDMWATASVVIVGCCRWWTWLLKYIIYEILCLKERKVKVTMSLRTLRSLRWNRKSQPSICVYLSSSAVNQHKSASNIIVEITGFWHYARNGKRRRCARPADKLPALYLILIAGAGVDAGIWRVYVVRDFWFLQGDRLIYLRLSEKPNFRIF